MRPSEKFHASRRPIQIAVIDNYDSFTENVVDLLTQLGASCAVHLNDSISLAALLATDADAFVVSPGPCTPSEAGISLPLFQAALAGEDARPILGVCLGHQALAQAAGAKVVRARPVHGRTSPIRHDESLLFNGLPQGFLAGRYNSLVVAEETLPDTLVVAARADDDRHVMALRHLHLPLHSVQFHPESHLTQHGRSQLRAFLGICPREAADGKPIPA